ncbi:MAG TPA: hypothetical protein VIG77_01335 [Ktedonobacterales bacterium]|jgi:hypothetical protein
MRAQSAPPERLSSSASATDATSGVSLNRARIAWGTVAALCLALFVASLPTRIAELQRVIPGGATTRLGELAAPRGLLIGGAATLEIGAALVYFTLAALVFWRRHDELRAIEMSLFLLAFGAALPGLAFAIMSATPIWRSAPAPLQAVGWAALLLFAYRFPSGEWSPRWSRWVAPWWLVWVACFFAFAQPVFAHHPQWIVASYLIWVAWFGTGVCAQLYRYLWVATPLQRQQSKWVMLGFVCALVGILLASVDQIVALSQGRIGQSDLRFTLLALVVVVCTSLPIPISITIAILRHNLFDIDRLIKLTLLYSALTVILGGAYVATVAASQALLRAVTGLADSSSLALVVSTLGVAALFQPLRRRMQIAIDRQFYRRRYDAARIAAAFAESLRIELNLSELHQRLIDAAYQAMRPQHISLWLTVPQRDTSDANASASDAV